MKLLYIADGRSQITLNWISHFIQAGHDVHLASTFPCMPIAGLTSLSIVPVAMSGSVGSPESGSATLSLIRKLIPVGWRTRIRNWTAPWTLPRAAQVLRQVIDETQPDLIHAMRIPFEGMAAAMAIKNSNIARKNQKATRLLISVWGNDFTLHAGSSVSMKNLTRQALQVCHGLHTDCLRDLRLAEELGFSPQKPAIVLPGGGGVKLDVFYPPLGDERMKAGQTPVQIIHPRGVRAYVRNDTIFHAMPGVVKQFPNARFVCPAMAGDAQAHKWVAEMALGAKVDLLPAQSPGEMAELFRRALISLSITTHDGTPNTLLEAMACGCFPIAGDIESLREWITPGENGLLVNPGDVSALSEAILQAIAQPELRQKAVERNLTLVWERGEYTRTMQRAEEFYRGLIEGNL